MSRSSLGRRVPPFRDGLQRRDVDEMKFAPPLAAGRDEPRRFEHVEVLGDRLARQGDPAVQHQPAGELEERLPGALAELVEDRAPRGRDQRVEHVAHGPQNRQA